MPSPHGTDSNFTVQTGLENTSKYLHGVLDPTEWDIRCSATERLPTNPQTPSLSHTQSSRTCSLVLMSVMRTWTTLTTATARRMRPRRSLQLDCNWRISSQRRLTSDTIPNSSSSRAGLIARAAATEPARNALSSQSYCESPRALHLELRQSPSRDPRRGANRMRVSRVHNRSGGSRPTSRERTAGVALSPMRPVAHGRLLEETQYHRPWRCQSRARNPTCRTTGPLTCHHCHVPHSHKRGHPDDVCKNGQVVRQGTPGGPYETFGFLWKPRLLDNSMRRDRTSEGRSRNLSRSTAVRVRGSKHPVSHILCSHATGVQAEVVSRNGNAPDKSVHDLRCASEPNQHRSLALEGGP